MLTESDMILAVNWQGIDLTGSIASEKLNGCRVEWDGESFWTRSGNRVNAPAWFTKGLPKRRINGEIHCGRGVGIGNNNSGYKVAMRAVVHGGDWFRETDNGEAIRFTALYLPDVCGSWADRQLATRTTVRSCKHAAAIKTRRIRSPKDFAGFLKELHAVNAEGAMFIVDGDGKTGRTGELRRFKFHE